jgi:hypothetical protein
MNLKKLKRYLRVNLLGLGPRLIKRIYRAAISQRLRNTALDDNDGDDASSQGKSTLRSKTMYTDRQTDSHLTYIIFKSKSLKSAWRRNSFC